MSQQAPLVATTPAIAASPATAHPSIVRSELILGGQRSGKSRRAEQLAQRWLEVKTCAQADIMPMQAPMPTPSSSSPPAAGPRRAIFIATAEAHDDEMAARIRRHQADRAERLPGMLTIEEPRALAEVIGRHSAPDCLLVIDCLTLWLANQYDQIEGFAEGRAASDFLQAIEAAPGPLVLVSNEVGLGVVPLGREVRAYVDALGWLNQQVAARCDRVCLMAAGLPLWLKPADTWPGTEASTNPWR